MILLRRILPLATLAALIAAAHGQVTVYSNNFTTAANATNATWSDSTLSTSNGESFLGGSANGFGNGTDTLTLTNLAAGTVSLTFDFYAIQSWDGNGQNGGGPDNFSVGANGTQILITNFANYTGGNTQSYSAATPNGLGFANAPRSGAFDNGHLGYGTGDYGDSTYRLTLTFTNISPTLALAFKSAQSEGVGNEGWGLDNMKVVVVPTATPEPASFAAVGLGAVAFLRRRRKA